MNMNNMTNDQLRAAIKKTNSEYGREVSLDKKKDIISRNDSKATEDLRTIRLAPYYKGYNRDYDKIIRRANYWDKLYEKYIGFMTTDTKGRLIEIKDGKRRVINA